MSWTWTTEGFLWLDKSQHPSGTCETYLHLLQGVISTPSGRRDVLICGTYQPIEAHAGLQAPQFHKDLLCISKFMPVLALPSLTVTSLPYNAWILFTPHSLPLLSLHLPLFLTISANFPSPGYVESAFFSLCSEFSRRLFLFVCLF